MLYKIFILGQCISHIMLALNLLNNIFLFLGTPISWVDWFCLALLEIRRTSFVMSSPILCMTIHWFHVLTFAWSWGSCWNTWPKEQVFKTSPKGPGKSNCNEPNVCDRCIVAYELEVTSIHCFNLKCGIIQTLIWRLAWMYIGVVFE